MQQEYMDFINTHKSILTTKYNNDNLEKMFSKLDRTVFQYLTPVVIESDIYFVSKANLSKEDIKVIEIKMFPVLSKYGYELTHTKFKGKEIHKLVVI